MYTVAQLLQPVSPERRCGDDLSFSAEVDQIARAREYDDPTLDQGEWTAPLKEADWEYVAGRCAEMLATRSKDLRLAAWLAEALCRTRGLRGLGDGYAVFAGLCAQYWTDLYPLVDDGDYDQRIGNLFWLLARTPALVQGCTVPAPTQADAEYCLERLIELEHVADAHLGEQGPGFGAARDAVQALLRSLAPAGSVLLAADSADVLNGNGTCSALQTRAQALQQLRQIADFFHRTEPHSPVAYLAERAAGWGEMPLHVWLATVVRDPATRAGLDDLLGVAPPAE